MQPLDLNLASRPFRNNTLLWSAYGVGVALLLVFTVWNVQTFRGQSAALDELRGKVENYDRRMAEFAMRAERAQRSIERYDLKQLTIQAAKANDVIEWKAFSWTKLFNLLEELQPYKVKMLSIRPVFYSTERRNSREKMPAGAIPVHVEGIAIDLRTFLAFERELLLDPQFDRIEPEKTNKLENKEIKFELRFLYFPELRSDVEVPEIPQVVEDIATPRQFEQMIAEREATTKGDGDTPKSDERGKDTKQDGASVGQQGADERAAAERTAVGGGGS